MRTTSILVAALAAVSAVAAQDNRPKIYFPKYVKRQFGNSTSSNELPSGEPAASSSAPPADESTPPPRVTTIVIASTIYVPPPPPSEAPASSLPVTTPPSSAPSAGGAASSGSVPSVIVTPTSRSSAAPASSSAPAASSPDTSSPAASSPAASSVPHTSSALTIAPTGVVSSAASSTPVLTSTTTTPVDPLTSFLSQVVSELTSALLPTPSSTESPSVAPTTTSPSVAASSPPASSPAASSPATSDPITLLPSLSLTLLPSLSISVPPILPTTSTSVIPSGSGITGGGTGSAPITSTPVSTPPPISTPPPPPVTNVTESVPPTTLPPTTAPVSLNTTATEPPPVSVPTTAVPPPVSVNTTATANATVVPPPATSATSEEPATATSGVYSILPTATVSNSAPFLPTTLIIGGAPSTTSGASAPTTATSIPTTLPKAITPDTGSQPQPADTTLIQIGFLYGMNYAFVASNGKAAAQIFQLLPQALSYAGGFDVDKAQVQKLVPLNTYQSLGYATTLAVVSYPSDLIDTLRMDVRIPTSSLYNNPEQLVYNLTMEINPAIDIILGSYPADGGSAAGPSPSGATANPSPNSDPFNGNDATSSPESSTQRGTTVGIVTGSVAVAAAYGAVMFILARRYKRKKQAHRRASSISSPSEMRQTGSPALMGGAHLSRDFTDSYGAAGGRDSHGSGRSGMGNSGRTAYISAPVAAENSLGWN